MADKDENHMEEQDVIKYEATPGFAFIYYASMSVAVIYLVIVIFFSSGHH